MDLLKQLGEAKAQGLSKEEFFRLLDAEVKLCENKRHAPGTDRNSVEIPVDLSKILEKFLHSVDERLKGHEQQQLAKFDEGMKEQRQQFQRFQEQQQQQFQHLQQQQDKHEKHMQQLQQMLMQVQKQGQHRSDVQTQQSQHAIGASYFSKEHENERQDFESALSQVKENFHEMRSTVLNRLEEEKIFMRDELSKAQHELKTNLSRVAENVQQVKDKIELADRTNMRDNITQDQMKQLSEVGLHVPHKNTEEGDSEKLERKMIIDKINSAQENMQQTATNLVQDLKDAITTHVKELKESAEENVGKLQGDLEDVKTDIIAVSDNEYQLLKNCLNHEGKPPEPCKTYVCDFIVKNFEKFVNTEETLDSLPWYIDQFHSCMKGSASFTKEGDMEAWVLYGRKPRRVGLQPQSDISAKVKASVVDLTGYKEPLFIAEEVWYFNEDEIEDGSSRWGTDVGSIKCAKVVDMGFVNLDGEVCIRFEIEIL